MVRPLSKEKQQDVLALLQKGCSLKKTTKILHVYKFSVQRLCKNNFSNVKLSIGFRPRKLISAIEWSCVSSITRGKMFIARKATKHL